MDLLLSNNLRHTSITCLLSVCPVTQEDPTKIPPPPKTPETARAETEKEPRNPSNPPYSPSLALLRLLQTAFNRQTPALQQPQSAPAWRKKEPSRSLSPPATRLPPQTLYQALDLINKYRGPEDSVYSDYSDGFYSNKPYRHRDDRLLQALFEMIDNNRK